MLKKAIDEIFSTNFFLKPLDKQVERFKKLTDGKVGLVPNFDLSYSEIYKEDTMPPYPQYFCFFVITGKFEKIGTLILCVDHTLKHFDYETHFKNYRTARNFAYHRFDCYGGLSEERLINTREVHYFNEDVKNLLFYVYEDQLKEQLEAYVNNRLSDGWGWERVLKTADSDIPKIDENADSDFEEYLFWKKEEIETNRRRLMFFEHHDPNRFSDISPKEQKEEVKDYFGDTIHCRLDRFDTYGIYQRTKYDDPIDRRFAFEIFTEEKGKIGGVLVEFDYNLDKFDYDICFKNDVFAFKKGMEGHLGLYKDEHFLKEYSHSLNDPFFKEDFEKAFSEVYHDQLKEEIEIQINSVIGYMLNDDTWSKCRDFYGKIVDDYKKSGTKQSFPEYFKQELEYEINWHTRMTEHLRFFHDDPYFEEAYEGIKKEAEKPKKREIPDSCEASEDFNYDEVEKLTEEDLEQLGIHLNTSMDTDFEQKQEMPEECSMETEEGITEKAEEKVQESEKATGKETKTEIVEENKERAEEPSQE